MQLLGARAAIAAIGATVAITTACGGFRPFPYTPRPEGVVDPTQRAGTLLVANTAPSCMSEPRFTDALLVVTFVCSRGVGNEVVRFDKVERITLEQDGDWYRIRVHHRGPFEDFVWSSRNLVDLERLADAFSALARAHGSG